MSEVIKSIPLRNIHPSRLNPRLDFNIERLNELSASIREVGLLEPIVVRPRGGEYEVIVGERRYRACLQTGMSEVLAIVRDYTDEQVIQLNLIENIHREDLNAIEKGAVCRQLLDKYSDRYPSTAELARKVGVSVGAISLWLKAAEIIPEEAKEYVSASAISGEVPDGKIDYQTAIRVGRSIREPQRQVEIIRALAEKKPSVKERKQIIEKASKEPEKPIQEVFKEASQVILTLDFKTAELEPIMNGSKTQSSRISPPATSIKPGAIVQAAVMEPHFADLRITSIERKRLKYFDVEDAKREGGYTLKEFKRRWREMNEQWDENQFAYVIHFEKMLPKGRV
jgi:ParB/RepB/Spo0J family partition protein